MRPVEALCNSIDKQVTIVCKDGTTFEGKIAEVDEFMNIVLHEPQEAKNGKLEKSQGLLLVKGMDIFMIILDGTGDDN